MQEIRIDEPKPRRYRPKPSVIALMLLLGGPACSQAPQPEGSEATQQPSRPGLYQCDGCEVTTEHAPDELDWRVDLPPAGEPGERLVLSGHVFLPDGGTPAPGVVLYLHHTDAEGRYRSRTSTSRGGRGDGIIEGWLVTDAAGQYEITTIRPAPYPEGGMPAHVHVYVKEPERRPYYIDDFVFEGDPYLTPAYRAGQELRGGSGVVRLTRGPDGSWQGRRDIVLER